MKRRPLCEEFPWDGLPICPVDRPSQADIPALGCGGSPTPHSARARQLMGCARAVHGLEARGTGQAGSLSHRALCAGL